MAKLNPIVLFCVCLLLVPCIQAVPFQPCGERKYYVTVESVEMFPTSPLAGQNVDFTFRVHTSLELSKQVNVVTIEQVLLSKVPPQEESREGPYPYCRNTPCQKRAANSKFDVHVRQKMPITPGPKSLQMKMKNQNNQIFTCVNVDFNNQLSTPQTLPSSSTTTPNNTTTPAKR